MAILDGRDLATCRGFTGYLGDRSISTSLVELDEVHRRLWIRLASVSRFSVALDTTATDLLIDTLTESTTCAVRCEHADGPRLLGASPPPAPGLIPHGERRLDQLDERSRPPMRLYLHLGPADADRIEITLSGRATDALLAHLGTCRAAMRD